MTRTMICGDCWQAIRPTEYEPLSSVFGDCSRCGDLGFLSRVRRAEVEANPVDLPDEPVEGIDTDLPEEATR